MRLNWINFAVTLVATFRKMIRTFFIFLLLIFPFGEVLSLEKVANTDYGDRKSPRVYAIVIGISEYQEIGNLDLAAKDARSITNIFKDTLGLDERFVYSFYDEAAILTSITLAMDDVVEKAGRGDRVFFYFAGHGASENKDNAKNGKLLLCDAPESNYDAIKNGALPISFLDLFSKKLTQKGALLCLMVDACYAGQIAAINKNAVRVERQLKEELTEENVSILLSCSSKEVSIECNKLGGGVFTHYLRKAILEQIAFEELNNSVYSATKNQQTSCMVGLPPQEVFKDLKKMIAEGKTDLLPIKIESEEQQLYALFSASLTKNRLLLPSDSSALFYAKQLQFRFPHSPLTYKSTLHFLNILLQQPQKIINMYVKEECYITYSFSNHHNITVNDLKMALEYMSAALKLINTESLLFSQLKAKKLWFDFMNAKPYAKEDIEKFREYLEEAITLDSTAVLAYHRLGLSLIFHHLSEAKDLLNIVENLAPNWSFSYNGLGLYYNQIGSLQQAIACYKKGKELNANNSFLYGNLAYIYYRLCEFNLALNEWKEQDELNERIGHVFEPKELIMNNHEYFLCYMGLKDTVKSREHLNEIQRLITLHEKDLTELDKKYFKYDLIMNRACLDMITNNQKAAFDSMETFYQNLDPADCFYYNINWFNSLSHNCNEVFLKNAEFVALVNRYCPQKE